MNCRTLLLCIFLICLVTGLNAQSTPVVKDTVLTQKQKDRLFLKQAGKDRIEKFKKEFNKTWNKVFIDFTDNNVMLMAGMNFAKQNVRANGYTSPFIYAVEQKNVYKPGFFAGFVNIIQLVRTVFVGTEYPKVMHVGAHNVA